MKPLEFATLKNPSGRDWNFENHSTGDRSNDKGNIEDLLTFYSAEGWKVVHSKMNNPPYTVWMQREIKKK